MNACFNILPILYHHYYFPTYSNRLKDVATSLGYQFDNNVRSGVGSIVFRERWEETGDHVLKDAVIAYNRQDCEALKTICEFVRKSIISVSDGDKICGGNAEVVSAEALRKEREGNRPVFKRSEFVYPEFALVNKCAYFDYQRDLVLRGRGRYR